MNRLALVTGGTRGIGREISVQLSRAGYKVVANYAHNDEAAHMFHKETGIPIYKWDVANFEECEKSIARIEQDMGSSIEILVNNAGISRDGMMHKSTYKQWLDVIDTNLNSCYNMARCTISKMRETEFGRIISISSINGQAGQVGVVNYSAAKAGILGFTKALARESAAKGITVNAVAPGYIKTELIANISKDMMDKIVSGIPVGRIGRAEEVARVVVFLASDDSSFITGETISINGGAHME